MAQIKLLKANKVFTIDCAKYFDDIDVFLLKLTMKLLEYININDYIVIKSST